jgi:hypothetical protein
MAKRLIRWIIGTGLALSILFLVLYVWQIRPAIYRGHQICSLADMNTAARFLKDYREEHGEYPQELREAIPKKYPPPGFLIDGFGSPFLYESRNDGFILVSLGSDKTPDGIDYWELRGSFASMERFAGQFSADQVLSDRGWHREAGNENRA